MAGKINKRWWMDIWYKCVHLSFPRTLWECSWQLDNCLVNRYEEVGGIWNQLWCFQLTYHGAVQIGCWRRRCGYNALMMVQILWQMASTRTILQNVVNLSTQKWKGFSVAINKSIGSMLDVTDSVPVNINRWLVSSGSHSGGDVMLRVRWYGLRLCDSVSTLYRYSGRWWRMKDIFGVGPPSSWRGNMWGYTWDNYWPVG